MQEKWEGEDLHRGQKQIRGDRLGGGEQIKAERGGKDGWQDVLRDDQSGNIRWTSITRQALAPGETPGSGISEKDMVDCEGQ